MALINAVITVKENTLSLSFRKTTSTSMKNFCL